MNPQRYQQITELFNRLRHLPAPDCGAVLDQVGAVDPGLRREAEALLGSEGLHTMAGGEIRQAIADVAEALSEHMQDDRSPAVRIAGFEILGEIHRGGQGVVYQAVQQSTKREVAIKVLLEGPFASKSMIKRFEREIELVAQLNHAHIAAVLDCGLTPDGHHYYVMDYVRGVPLNSYVRDNQVPLEDALGLMAKVCYAVNYAHQRGVIHRDLKPSNILVDVHGQPQLLDFGVAKLMSAPADTQVSMTGQVVGTLPYMSPEQARGKPEEVDTRTDVYSLGVILYQVLTGQFPYAVTGEITEVLQHIAHTPPAPPLRNWSSTAGISRRAAKTRRAKQCPIDKELETVVLKALAKQRRRRYQSAGELGRDLEHYLAAEPIEARRDSRYYLLKKSLSVHKNAAAIFVLGLFLLLASVGAWNLWRTARRNEAAKKLLVEAVAVIGARADAAKARPLLDSAVALNPDSPEAHLYLGLLTAIEGLDQPQDNKVSYFTRALEHLADAHHKAGGQLPDLLADQPAAATTWGPGGSREALVYMVQLCNLLNRPREARRLLQYLESDPDYGQWGQTLPRISIYERNRDPLIGWPGPESPDAARVQHDDGAWIVRTLPDRIETLSPFHAETVNAYVIELIFDALVHINSELLCEPNRTMIEHVESDCTMTKVLLKPGLFWHDGVPLTAHDVAYSWKHIPQGHFGSARSNLLSVEAADARRVVFHHTEDVADPLWDLIFPIVPQHVYERHLEQNADDPELADRMFGRQPIGNGPYRLIAWRGDRIELERWPQYPGKKPYIKQVVFELYDVADPEQRLKKLSKGKIDETALSAGEFRWAVNGESFRNVVKVHQSRWAYDYICWNTASPLFSDPRIRRALTMALDLQTIIATQFDGLYEPCAGMFPARMSGADIELLPHDPQRAGRELDQAGWLLGADGVRRRQGQEFAFSLLVRAESQEKRLVVMDLAAQLRAVGVVMDPQPTARRDFFQQIRAGTFDAFVGAVVLHPNPDRARRRWSSQGAVNRGAYRNARVDALFEQARLERDAPRKRQLYGQINELIYQEQPYTFLWQRPTLAALSDRVRGVVVTDLGIADFHPGPRDWWIPADGAMPPQGGSERPTRKEVARH